MDDILKSTKSTEQSKMFLSIINNLRDGVYLVDNERRIVFWNKAAEEITGYPADIIIGHHCQDNILNHIDKEGHPLCTMGCPLFNTIVDGKPRKSEVYLRHRNGYRIPVLVNILPVIYDNEVVGGIEIFTPMSGVVYEDDLVSSLSSSAMNDQLTGLPNRRHLESYINYKYQEFKKFNHSFAIVFLDIDNFSSFNNIYGHDIGDLVLKNIASSVKLSSRSSDLIGRWGGEEFIGVYSISDSADALIIGEKVRTLIQNTLVKTEYGELSVTASIGVAVIQEDDTVESVVKRADDLMYKSKQNGKNRVSC